MVEKNFITEWAERRLAARYHWDLDVFRAKRPVSPGDMGSYRIGNPGRVLFQRRPTIKALFITEWHRFGNSVKQLRNVFHAADMLDISTICFAKAHPVFAGEGVQGPRLIWQVENSGHAPSIEGSFFHLDAFGLAPTPAQTSRIFASLIRPLVKSEIQDADPRVAEDDVVLHFRSGDAFSEPESAQNHGQPPLSYYLSAVERERPARVWLVFEDRGNPCIDEAEAALKSFGIDVMIQSTTLVDDIRLLMSARRLVAGRGSFAYWIAHLSGRLRRAYFLHKPGRMWALRHLGVEVVLAEDRDGEFEAKVLRGNWEGSPAQKELLLAYPAEKLKFSILGPRDAKIRKKGRAPITSREFLKVRAGIWRSRH